MTKHLQTITLAEVLLSRESSAPAASVRGWKLLPLLLLLAAGLIVFAPEGVRPAATVLFCLGFALIMRNSGLNRAMERKNDVLDVLRMRYRALQLRPGETDSAFESRVTRLSTAHSRITLNESVVVPLVGLLVGLVHGAGAFLAWDQDHTTFPALSIVFLVLVGSVFIQHLEHRRLRRLISAMDDRRHSSNA